MTNPLDCLTCVRRTLGHHDFARSTRSIQFLLPCLSSLASPPKMPSWVFHSVLYFIFQVIFSSEFQKNMEALDTRVRPRVSLFSSTHDLLPLRPWALL
jgi:hypothetical protein